MLENSNVVPMGTHMIVHDAGAKGNLQNVFDATRTLWSACQILVPHLRFFSFCCLRSHDIFSVLTSACIAAARSLSPIASYTVARFDRDASV